MTKQAMLVSIIALLFVVGMVEAVGYVPVGEIDVRLLALVPLSGTESIRGQAQLAGINLAIQEELHRLNGLPHTHISFTYNDTQVCHLYIHI